MTETNKRFDKLLKAMLKGDPPKRKGGVALPADPVTRPASEEGEADIRGPSDRGR
jgi:hypothetical protein